MPEPTVDSASSALQHQVRQLSDRMEIAELIGRLALWLDDKRFEDARSILHEDVAVTTRSGTVQGAEAATAQARQRHTEERTQHVVTNIVIDLDGDHAAVQANLIATFVPRASAPQLHNMVGERYRFDAVRTASGWRLARIEVSPLWHTAVRDGDGPDAPQHISAASLDESTIQNRFL